MENKLGRKSMYDWQAMTNELTARVYESGFKAGYDVAKIETPDVEDMTAHLIDRYTDRELEELAKRLDSFVSIKLSTSRLMSEIANNGR